VELGAHIHTTFCARDSTFFSLKYSVETHHQLSTASLERLFPRAVDVWSLQLYNGNGLSNTLQVCKFAYIIRGREILKEEVVCNSILFFPAHAGLPLVPRVDA
jgi:hypothetical protein